MRDLSHGGSRKSVAIVGTGMAGLVSAYLLSNDPEEQFDVEVFEAQDQLSLDSASVTTYSKDGKQSARVDQPMRGFDGYYGNLRAMYDYLGIDYDPHRFLFSYSRLSNAVSKDKEAATEPLDPYFVHSSRNHRIPPLRPDRWKLWDWISEVVYLLFCFAYTVICCFVVRPREGLRTKDGERVGESLGQYLNRIYMPSYFIQNYLLPPLASMATCSLAAVLEFPATDLVHYIQKSFNTSPRLVSSGIQEVQTKLSDGLKITFGSRVTSIVPNEDSKQVTISYESTTTNSSQRRTFDHVITAVPPNTLGAILPTLKQEMENMPIVPVETVVHTDPTPVTTAETTSSSNSKPQLFSSLHPSPGSQWIHMRMPPSGVPETTHEHPFSVLSTNSPQTRIDPSKVISRTVFTRTLRTPKSRALVQRIFDEDDTSRELRGGNGESASRTWRNGDGNVWLAGSWCWDGMVLLEGCIVSSMRVADSLGVQVPWREKQESI